MCTALFHKAECGDTECGEMYRKDVVSDLLVGVIYANQTSGKNSLLWFLISSSKNKNNNEKVKSKIYQTMINELAWQGTKIFQHEFGKMLQKENTPCYSKIQYTMAKRFTGGLHSLPCRVADCVRYILRMGQNEIDMQNKQMGNDSNKETANRLHRAIKHILEDKTYDIKNDPVYAHLKRIKDASAHLFTDKKVLKRLGRFLRVAHAATKEEFKVWTYL